MTLSLGQLALSIDPFSCNQLLQYLFFVFAFVIECCTEPVELSSTVNQDKENNELSTENEINANHSSLPTTTNLHSLSPPPPPVPARRYQQSNDENNDQPTPVKSSTILNGPKFYSTGSVRSLLAKKFNLSTSPATIKRSLNHSLGKPNSLTNDIFKYVYYHRKTTEFVHQSI